MGDDDDEINPASLLTFHLEIHNCFNGDIKAK